MAGIDSVKAVLAQGLWFLHCGQLVRACQRFDTCWVLLVLMLHVCCCHRDRPAGSNAQGTLTVSAEFLPFSESLLDATVAESVQVSTAWAPKVTLACSRGA
jgi:hypothetical protein